MESAININFKMKENSKDGNDVKKWIRKISIKVKRNFLKIYKEITF